MWSFDIWKNVIFGVDIWNNMKCGRVKIGTIRFGVVQYLE